MERQNPVASEGGNDSLFFLRPAGQSQKLSPIVYLHPKHDIGEAD
jgi:hypothetical protein